MTRIRREIHTLRNRFIPFVRTKQIRIHTRKIYFTVYSLLFYSFVLLLFFFRVVTRRIVSRAQIERLCRLKVRHLSYISLYLYSLGYFIPEKKEKLCIHVYISRIKLAYLYVDYLASDRNVSSAAMKAV